jgi:hypothetical protein
VLVATTLLLAGASVAWAWTTSSTNPATSVSGAVLAAPANLSIARTPASGNVCTALTVTWDAVPGANRYKVEGRVGGTAFSTLSPSHTTTSFTYVATFAHRTLFARVTPFIQGSSWEGSPSYAQVTCGIGQIEDLQVTNPCSSSELTWTAPPGATNYDVQRRINGGGLTTISTNQSGTTYSDNGAPLGSGDSVEYRIIPGNGATNGVESNIETIGSWEPFRVTSILLANAGTTGVHNSGDTVTVMFSKPVDTTSMTRSTVYVQRGGGNSGIWLAADNKRPDRAQLGGIITANRVFDRPGNNRAIDGGVAWSASDTTWTWTSTDTTAGPYMDSDVSGSWTVGTQSVQARCAADGSTELTDAPAPSIGGRW